MIFNKNSKVSVITVTLNSRQYIERAIKSLLSQTYGNIEHVIIDGGSTDGTLEILDKYRDKIDFFVSEPDKGLYDAMNKGINHSTGDILYFFNSDDRFYDKDVIKKAVYYFSKKRADFIYGDIVNYHVDAQNYSYGRYPNFITKRHFIRSTIGHPATFFHRRCFEKVGVFDIRYKIVSDYEWFLRALFKYHLKQHRINEIISIFQCSGISTDESNKEFILREKESIQKLYFKPWELRIGRWLNFFLYGDIFRILARFIIGKKRYEYLSNSKKQKDL